jgi:hypothetical protein
MLRAEIAPGAMPYVWGFGRGGCAPILWDNFGPLRGRVRSWTTIAP